MCVNDNFMLFAACTSNTSNKYVMQEFVDDIDSSICYSLPVMEVICNLITITLIDIDVIDGS